MLRTIFCDLVFFFSTAFGGHGGTAGGHLVISMPARADASASDAGVFSLRSAMTVSTSISHPLPPYSQSSIFPLSFAIRLAIEIMLSVKSPRYFLRSSAPRSGICISSLVVQVSRIMNIVL